MELISDMEQCKTIIDCCEIAMMDANGEDEAAVGWLTCVEEMFSKFKQVKVLGNTLILEGFDLKRLHVMARCRNGGGKSASISLDSVEFPSLNESEKLWLDAVKHWNENG